jgi:dihydroxyacid dehydratase/phosphogluconate dehydratase
MDENILDSLIQILQKHANAIQKLKVANIALMELARQEAENSGTPSEEFEKRFLAILSSAEESGPLHNPFQSISKQIEETVETLDLIEKQKGKLN